MYNYWFSGYMYSGYLLYDKNLPSTERYKTTLCFVCDFAGQEFTKGLARELSSEHVVSAETAGAEGSLPRWHLHSCLQPWCAWLCSLSLSFSLLPHPWHLTLKDTSP